jgi:hypothetical protein
LKLPEKFFALLRIVIDCPGNGFAKAVIEGFKSKESHITGACHNEIAPGITAVEYVLDVLDDTAIIGFAPSERFFRPRTGYDQNGDNRGNNDE